MGYLERLINKITHSDRDGEFKMANFKGIVIDRRTHFTIHLYKRNEHFADWTYDKDFNTNRIEIYRGIPNYVEKTLRSAILKAGYLGTFEVKSFLK